jgi:hypothetical protein
MAVDLIFKGTIRSLTDQTELQVYHNVSNEIFIQIEDEDRPPSWICLDKETAIKFSKELRKQISYFENE